MPVGKVYWEEDGKYEQVDKTQSKKDYVFTNNLLLIFNKLKVNGTKFVNVRAIPKKKSSYTIYEVETEDTIYRELGDIETKEDFLNCVRMINKWRDKKYSYYHLRINLAHSAYSWAKAVVIGDDIITGEKDVQLLMPTTHQICRKLEPIYKASSSAYLSGYNFNVADPNKIYTDVYSFDYKSNHASIICYQQFPYIIEKKDIVDFGKDEHFYGRFSIKIKRYDPYVFKLLKGYNDNTRNEIRGWYNNIDLEFIEELCGIEDIICEEYWKVKVRYTNRRLCYGIRILFDWIQKAEGFERKFLKLALEKIYGNSVKKRFYDKLCEWDKETQQIQIIAHPYNWEEVQKTLIKDKYKGNFDYTMGVWVCSYARLRLLRLRRALEAVGCEVLYGDIDCIKFRGEQGLKIIEKINKNFPPNFDLGKLKFEYKAVKFKAVDLKWYCGIDEEGNIEAKTAGANTEIVGNWLKSLPNPVESFTKDFPPEIKPFKRVEYKPDGTCEVKWVGSEQELKADPRAHSTLIVSCAGSGKTTTLVEKVKELIPTGEPITVIAFTNKNVDELKERIRHSPNLEIRTIDSLAASFLDNQIDGDNFQLKLETATQILVDYPKICKPSHLFVDEFQDLDTYKFNFIKALPVLSRFFIGDPNQSIYGYSGAIDLFGKLTNFKVEKRTTNYRCGQIINDYAEGFLAKEKRPHATCIDKGGEVKFIDVKELEQLNCVVLCRTNNQIETLQKRFPQLTYLTIHKAKGLTFDEVAVVGIEERKENSEEQNIAYVAATRPRKILYVVRGEINGI